MSTPRCCGTLTTLKATLNHAFDEGLVKNNNAWGRRLKPFLNVDVARIRYLTVDEAQRLINPNDLFEQAQSAEEAGDLAEAERLYRILMKCDPMDASAPFNLGNLLRACTRNVEAEAAFRAATRTDPTFADVLDGDHGLVGEGRDHLNLLFRKWAHCRAAQNSICPPIGSLSSPRLRSLP
jgi:tetratricopeptide (TPR) repeat protein